MRGTELLMTDGMFMTHSPDTNPASPPPPPAVGLRILILDDEASIRSTLRICLEAFGHHVEEAGTASQAIEIAANRVFDLLFLDLRLGTDNGLDYIRHFLEQSPWLKIVVITAYASIDTAVEAMRRGATDYLPKPFTPEQVEMLAGKVAEVRSLEMRVRELQDALGAAAPETLLVSDSRPMCEAIQLAGTFAPSRAALLIQGESGTGKRTLARAIHQWSARKTGPFMQVSSKGLNEVEIAAELFGGALQGRPGGGLSRVEACAGGTLYIEDASVLPQRLQLKLLQLANFGTFEREGDYEQIPADVRIIVGATESLQQQVASGLFREDLYYALSSKTIELSPLRDRAPDIKPLAEIFLAFYARRTGKAVSQFTKEAIEYLHEYKWPGNVRELRNVVERAVILTRASTIGLQNLPPNMLKKASAAELGDLVPLEMIEELHIRGVLGTTRSLESAAKILGIDYATLWRRRRKYGL
jgi:two-component system, NtrC family, response regulator AlgB